jgi:hypothetical protein
MAKPRRATAHLSGSKPDAHHGPTNAVVKIIATDSTISTRRKAFGCVYGSLGGVGDFKVTI